MPGNEELNQDSFSTFWPGPSRREIHLASFQDAQMSLCIPRFVQLVARQLRKPHITVRTRPSTKRLSKINRRRNHFNKLTRPACWCMPLCRLLTCQARLLLSLVRFSQTAIRQTQATHTHHKSKNGQQIIQ